MLRVVLSIKAGRVSASTLLRKLSAYSKKNRLYFHNVFSLSRILHDLQEEEYPLQAGAVAALSPYVTQQINRFGRYDLDMEQPPKLVYDLWT